MRVLAVDDNPTQLLIVRQQLEHLGHVCVTAMDGAQAVDVFFQESPRLVLTDVEMPGVRRARYAPPKVKRHGRPLFL